MCGINGALSYENSSFEINEPYINEMRDQMIHRGPDGCGTWISRDKKVGLGHRRLSIIDLSEKASQPMANEDKSIVISFNGEIYNHAEVRKEISSKENFSWKTDHSDTEVVLRAYELWGMDAIKKFRGMFAIAIWDSRKQKLFLIRDRIGIKPLYYTNQNGRLIFASEIKAILKDRDVKRKVNLESFYHYLSFLTTPAPQTLFDGIYKIPAGHYLEISKSGSIQDVNYWDVWDHTTPLVNKSEDDIASELLEILTESVKLRKVSDVDVGVFLSGGIDSSTNAALFSDRGNLPLKTFSIGYDTDYSTYKNELHYAQKMANEVHADHHELRLNQNHLFDFLPKMIQLQDEPIADPVCVPVYYVSKLAKDNGVTVCQVGEGADELFWGYDSWKIKLKLQNYNDLPVPNALKKLGLAGLRALGKQDSLYYEFLRRGVAGQPVFWGGAESFVEAEKQKLISNDVKKEIGGLNSWDALSPIYDRFQEKAWEKSHLNWMSYLDLSMRLPELLLMRVDKMSMGVSLEGRVPFLDHKFVEYAMSIPSIIKTKNDNSKHILKKAVRGLIPDELIDRKKQGFGVPVYDWYFNEFGEQARNKIREFQSKTNFFSAEAIEDLFSSNRGPQVWYILNFVLWWNEYIDG